MHWPLRVRHIRGNDGADGIDVHGAVQCGHLWSVDNSAHSRDVRRHLCNGPLLSSRVVQRYAECLPAGLLWGDDGPLRLHVHGSLQCWNVRRDNSTHSRVMYGAVQRGLLWYSRNGAHDSHL